jgi:3-keto-disaccharide hydrolase
MIDHAHNALYYFAPSRLCVKFLPLVAIAIVTAVFGANVWAADNELTPAEKADGWMLLFDGKSTTGWKNSNDKPVAAKIEDGAVNPHGSGGYLLVYNKPFGDFELTCDVKMDQPYCNSGIFTRVGDLKDPVQTGLEVQVVTDPKPDLHGFGSIYDLVAPSKNATHGPGNWDRVDIRCKGPSIAVTVNGEKVASMNCDEWTKPGKRLDGTANKYEKAVKDFPRKGYIGLQDHGYNVWYKNIKLKKLAAK